MPRLSNQQKSERRNTAMNEIARQVFAKNKEFRYFLIPMGENDPEEPTWRRLETWLKQSVQAGKKIEIVVVESSASGD